MKMYAIATLVIGAGLPIVGLLTFHSLIYPKSITQWAWYLLLVAPVSLAILFVGDFVSSNKVTRAVERKTERKSFSFLRVGYGLSLMALVMCGCFGLVWVFGIISKVFL